MAIADNPHIALVGPSTLLGQEVKEHLAAAGYPSASVALLDLDELAGLITEYGEEARVLSETAEEDLLRQDLVCFCGDSTTIDDHLPQVVEAGHFAIDCTGTWSLRDNVALSHPPAGRIPTPEPGTAIALPSGPALLLGSVLAALSPDTEGAVATVLMPASEHGDDGVEELAQQSIAVLNLADQPNAAFGRQLAFDVWPPASDGAREATAAVVTELRQLALPVPAVSLLRASVFHSISATLYLPHTDVGRVLGEIEAHGEHVEDQGAEDECIDSPTRVAGKPGMYVGRAWADGAGGAWLWLVMDNLQARAAAAAATVQALIGPPPAG